MSNIDFKHFSEGIKKKMYDVIRRVKPGKREQKIWRKKNVQYSRSEDLHTIFTIVL